MDLKKKTRNGSGSGPGFIKKPKPDPRPDSYKNPYKTRYPKLQKYPNIYIYSYNLTLTNPSFFNLQSSAAAQHSSQNSVPFPQPIRGTQSLPHFCTVRSAQSTQSSVRSAPHASRFTPPSPSPSHAQSDQHNPLSPVRSAQSRPLTVTLSLSLF